MQISFEMLIIICPLLFLAGLIDAIGGGGSLISLPAYMLVGLPPHTAIATNKMSSVCGTALATFRFFKNGLISFRLAAPAVVFAIAGSYTGSGLSLLTDEKILKILMLLILPVTAFFVLNKRIFTDKGKEGYLALNTKTYVIASLSALIVGMYDGFYGPGTGTFLIIAFTVFAKMDIKTSNAQAKIINLTTNLTALAVFLLNGQVFIELGIFAAVSNMLGGYIGAGLAMSSGSRIIKPCIIIVLILLTIKILTEF